MENKIYRVKIGTTTRKGNFQAQVDNVVSFCGERIDLHSLMVKRYAGFTVSVEDVPVIQEEIIQPEKDSTLGKRITTTSGYQFEILLPNFSMSLADVIGKEKEKKIYDLEKEIGELHSEALKAFSEKVRSIPGVLYVSNSYIENHKIISKLRVNSHMYLQENKIADKA